MLRELRGGADEDGPLTAREREVTKLLAEGKNSRDIGRLLGISPKTSDVHRANIMRKLNIRSMGELVRYSIRRRWVDA